MDKLYSVPDLLEIEEWEQYAGLGHKKKARPAREQTQWRPVVCVCFAPPAYMASHWQLLQTQCYFSNITTNCNQ